MNPMAILRSPKTAFVTFSFVIAAALVFGYSNFGWLGVGFVGLLGLIISLRAEMFEEYGDPHERSSAHTVQMYAQQLENRKLENRGARLSRHSKDLQRHVTHRVINAIMGAIMVAGLAMWVMRSISV